MPELRLTGRQQHEIAHLVGSGYSSGQIARCLGVTRARVSDCLATILSNNNLADRDELLSVLSGGKPVDRCAVLERQVERLELELRDARLVEADLRRALVWERAQVLALEQSGQVGEREPAAGGPSLCVDLDARRVTRDGDDVVHLTPREFQLLGVLAIYANSPLDPARLGRIAFGVGYEDAVDVVRMHIVGLRRKLEPEVKRPRWIVTRHSWGYLLRADSSVRILGTPNGMAVHA